MSQPDLSALQRRATNLFQSHDPIAKRSEAERVAWIVFGLAGLSSKLRKAQFSAVDSTGTAIDPIQPILVKQLGFLLALAPDLGLDLGQDMSQRSDAHRDPLLASNVSHINHMHKALHGIGEATELTTMQRDAMQEHAITLAWRIQTELQSSGTDIEARLEDYWADIYSLFQPQRAASHKTAAIKTGPAV